MTHIRSGSEQRLRTRLGSDGPVVDQVPAEASATGPVALPQLGEPASTNGSAFISPFLAVE